MLTNLKRLRKRAGISQQALADKLGISQQSINQYENSATEPDIYTLCRLADYFHTSIDFIVGREIPEVVQNNNFINTLLNEGEYLLVEKYRVLKPREQHCIDIVLSTLLDNK